MAPDHIEAALKENVKLKLQIMNMGKEMKMQKKVLVQQDRQLADLNRQRDGAAGTAGASKELQRLYEAEQAARMAAEKEMEGLRGKMDDLGEELARVTDVADKAEEEVERLQSAGVMSEEIEDVSFSPLFEDGLEFMVRIRS